MGSEQVLRQTYGRRPATLQLNLGSPDPMLTRRAQYPTIAEELAAPALSNDVRMSPSSEDNGRPGAAGESQGVLSNLPRTRPQRSSARRTAARLSASENGTHAKAGASPSKQRAQAPAAAAVPASKASAAGKPRAASKPRTSRSAPKRPRPLAADPAPIQGFESDGDRANGPVQPPGSSELAASVVEIIGELAKSGLSRGERLLKDVLAHLPLT
jgi:hypothetical protein